MVTELATDVITSFQGLKSALNTACEHIHTLDRHLPAWCQPPAMLHLQGNNYRENACKFLSQLEYLDQQQPREILVGAGIMAASAETLDVLFTLNKSKDRFKQAMLRLKDAKISNKDQQLAQTFEQLLPQRDDNIAHSMARLGLARLHLKQCYRRIPILNERPKRISWTWANTRSIKKISVQTAESLLIKHSPDPGIERQISLLRSLHPDEKLAIVQELAPHLRANILLESGKRVMVKGPVPIFYLMENSLGLPDFVPPGDKKGKDKERLIRKDVKINPQPFLPAIRAYRYYSIEAG